jgi:hypothetical protein
VDQGIFNCNGSNGGSFRKKRNGFLNQL